MTRRSLLLLTVLVILPGGCRKASRDAARRDPAVPARGTADAALPGVMRPTPDAAVAAVDAGAPARPVAMYHAGKPCLYGRRIEVELAGQRRDLGCGGLLLGGRAARTTVAVPASSDGHDPATVRYTVHGFHGQEAGAIRPSEARPEDGGAIFGGRWLVVRYIAHGAGGMPGQVIDLGSTRSASLGQWTHVDPRSNVMAFLGDGQPNDKHDVICIDLLTMKERVVGQVPSRTGTATMRWTGPLQVQLDGDAERDEPAYTLTFTCPPALDPSRPALKPVQAVPGPTFVHRGGPARTGVFGPDESGGRALAGQVRWEHKAGAGVAASVTIAGNLALVGDYGGTLYALDLGTGQPAWKAALGGKIRSAAAVAAGTVVVGTAEKAVHGLDLRTGTARWKVEVGGPVVSTPLIDGGVAYVGSHDGRLRALDLATGKVRWATDVGGEVWSSPLLHGNALIVGTHRRKAGGLVAVDRSSGAVVWRYELDAGVRSSLALRGSTAVLGIESGQVLAFDLAARKVLWTHATGAAVPGTPALEGSVAYIGAMNGKVLALDLVTGTVRWTYVAGRSVFASPTVHRGVVYVGAKDGKLHVIDAATGQARKAFRAGDLVDGSAAVSPNGLLVFGCFDGTIRALE